jgi:hypothetical protein
MRPIIERNARWRCRRFPLSIVATECCDPSECGLHIVKDYVAAHNIVPLDEVHQLLTGAGHIGCQTRADLLRTEKIKSAFRSVSEQVSVVNQTAGETIDALATEMGDN